MKNGEVMQILAKHGERLEHYGRRITKAEHLAGSIHKLTATMEGLAEEVRIHGTKMDKVADSLDERLKVQGERIGEIEKRGSKKLEGIMTTVVTVIITAAIMYFTGSSYLGM